MKKLGIIMVASTALLLTVLMARSAEPDQHARSESAHIVVVPKTPATAPVVVEMGSVGPLTTIPLPAPAGTKELENCKGRSLAACLDVINLRNVSGRLQLPARDGLAEITIRGGQIVRARVIGARRGRGSTRPGTDGE